MFKIPLFGLSSVFYTSCTKKEPYLFIGKTHKFKNLLNLMTLDLIDESLIQKKFVFDKSELNEKFSQLFDEIPQQYVELTVSIVEMAQKELGIRFDSSIYLALSDHITYAVRRYKKNENLKNALLFEII